MARQLLIFDDAPILGGAELFALRLARWIHGERAEWAVRIACPPSSVLAARCRAEGLPLEPVDLPKPTGVPSALRAIRALFHVRRLLAGGDGVVVGNTALAQAYLAVAHPMAPNAPALIHLLHERHTLERRLARFVLPRSGALVAVGERHAAAYRTALPRASVGKINIFLEPRQLEDAVTSRGDAPGNSPPSLGVLARLVPEKGILELLEELAYLPSAWSRLQIAGAAENPSYARLVSERITAPDLNGQVEMLGHVDDVGAFLAGIDVLVVPSTGTEGQVFAILEALAHGRPVSVRENALSPEYEGLPVEPFRDGQSLAAALRRLNSAGPADAHVLASHFGPAQALEGLERAATLCTGRARVVRPQSLPEPSRTRAPGAAMGTSADMTDADARPDKHRRP